MKRLALAMFVIAAAARDTTHAMSDSAMKMMGDSAKKDTVKK